MKGLKRAAHLAAALGCAALLAGCGTFAGKLGGAIAEGMIDSALGIERDPAEEDRQREADEFAKEMMKSDSARK